MLKIKPLARKNNIVIQEMENETLIYDLITNQAFNLNQTSALIWQLSDGNRNISEIADNLSKRFQSSVSNEFVWLALEQLSKSDLIDNKEDIDIDFDNVSRRELIKKIGLSTVVAFPIVSSLLAPMAIHSQSGFCGGGCQCPNATVSFCTPAGGGGTTICNNLNPTATCRCRAPFGTPGSGTSPGQKIGNCATA